ncbi:hypothetical protein DNTS_018370 [Danionella cerebrum]|uniref:Ig-like domain-containing protein n=1 Tax=Danionella cerebrum TaxID=2873325 RepID=A0A553R0C8_9TELE|nr:hypothetical protein DNTS_018370 [Danionella translucida]
MQGLRAVTLVPSANPVAVGSNVTLSLNESVPITVGLWLFGSSTLIMWYNEDILTGSSHQEGIDFDINTYQLTLTSVTLKRSGLYALDALKPNKTNIEFLLEVQEPVSNISTTVSGTSLVEFNDSVSFTCSANGTPMWFSWKNGSSTVINEGRVQLGNNGRSLVISGVTQYDSGPFSCMVANNISSQQNGPRDPTISPDKSTYTSGSSITLTCSAASNPVASFYWKFNGTLLNVNGPVFELTNTFQNLSGQYTCIAQNMVTLRYAAVTKVIQVIDPVSAVAVNSSGNLVEDMPFNLTCNAVGPVDSIQWLKDGVHLDPIHGITFSSDNTTLYFSHLIQSDDGLYQCTASNAVSSMTSKAYTLLVNYGPINTTASGFGSTAVGANVADGPILATAPVSQNQSGAYTCMAFNSVTAKSNNGSVMLTVLGNVDYIQWMKNGAVVFPNDEITFSIDNLTLSFNNLSIDDDGLYQCEAINPVSNMTSAAYNLMVNYGPWNTVIHGPNMTQTGSTVTLNCTADSYPESLYSWYYNNSWVGQGAVYVTKAFSLSGNKIYTCLAFNNITGLNSSSALALNVIGNVHHIQWMKNGTVVLPHDEITFSIDNLTLSFNNLSLDDDGLYQCEAINPVSNMTSAAYNLMVNYGPWNTVIHGPNMTQTGSTVTLNCTADSYPESLYSWYYNNSWVGQGAVYITKAFSLSGSKIYTCLAFNNITGLNSSSALALTVIEAIVTVNLTASPLIPLAYQSMMLTCNVKGPFNNLRWLRNNQTFQPSNGVTFSADNTTLSFSSLKTADDGRYQCVATNALQEYTSQPYDLLVIFGPQSVQVIVHPGIPPVLTCLALSQPPAVYNWILNSNTIVGNQSSIEIPINSILGSNYTCVAKNPLTGVTIYTSQVINNPNAAGIVKASVALTTLLVLLLPVLEEYF